MKRILKTILCTLLCVSCTLAAASCKKDKGTGSDTSAPETSAPADTKPAYNVTLPDRLIYDREGVKIRTAGMGMSDWGPEIKLEITNMTHSNVILGCKDTSVNGIMSEFIFHADVPPTATVNESIVIFYADIEFSSIEAIRELEFRITVTDQKTGVTEYSSELITLHTEGAEEYVQKADEAGVLIYDSKGIKIRVQKLRAKGNSTGSAIYLNIENTTDVPVSLRAGNVSINGTALYGQASAVILSGKRAYAHVTLLDAELKKNNITDIGSISLTLEILDMKTSDTIVSTDILTAELATFLR